MAPADLSVAVFRVSEGGTLIEQVGGSHAIYGNHELATVRALEPGRYRVVVTSDRIVKAGLAWVLHAGESPDDGASEAE